ncbi:MAG: hypothetical protein ACREQ3_08330, partial [Candidatus Binatia bacterium]
MAGFFRSLFRTGTERREPTPSQPVPPIEQMTVDEILAYVQALEGLSVKQTSALQQRLYDIAFFDHHVLPQHRDVAQRLAEALNRDWETAISDNPEALASLKRANDHVLEGVRLYGIGSLFWRIEEEAISDAEAPAYAMRPEHRHLVPDYFEAIGKEKVLQVREEFVRLLILAGQYKASSAVLILHGLAAKGDKAAVALFTVEEYAALLAVPNNYDAGRRVLVALGLLPDTSNTRPFKHIPEIKTIVAFVLKDRDAESASDNRLANIPEEQKIALLLALTSLRFHLAYDNIRQIYGEEMSNALMDIFTAQTTKEAIEKFGKTIHDLMAMPPGTLVDFM